MDLVAAVIRRGDHVLLVRKGATVAPEDGWALPGGRVGEGQLPPETLVREVRDATGFDIEVKDLIYISQVQPETQPGSTRPEMPTPGTSTTVLAFKADFAAGDISPSDGNDSGVEARFTPLEDALTLLIRQPLRSMAEPITSYLTGEVDRGSAWFYRPDAGGPERLIARFPPALSFRGKTPSTARRPLHAAIGTAEYERRQQIVVLGCLILVLFLVVLIIVGISALAHKG